MEEKLKKLEELVTKELEQITEKGLSNANLETTYKLMDILKDIKEVEEAGKETKGGEEEMKYFERGGRGGRGGYNGMYPMDYGEYNEGGYNARGGGGYNQGGGYNNQGGGGGYNGYSARNGRYQHYGPDIERFYEKLDRMMECVEEYFMGKNRYHDGAHPGHMVEGLEKTMYAVCTLVESLMDTAETPEEKETIRKHIEKIKNL